jgi:chromosome segregation ATPase
VRGSIHKLAVGTLAIFLVIGFLLVDSSAQKRKRRRRPSTPQITNPDIYQPQSTENSNNNSDQSDANSNSNSNKNANTSAGEDPEAMKRTIRTLSNQVDKLTDKISAMEESQRSLVDLERLSRAEQRSAQLRSDLREVQAKSSDLQVRLEDIDFALKPENIERVTQGYGTTRPEELREQRRRQLESEKQRVQKQLEQLAASEASLQQAIATSDAEVDRLRKKLDAADAAAIENAKKEQDAGQAYPSPSPTPTPF